MSRRLPQRCGAAKAALGRWVGVAAVDLILHVGTPTSLRLPLPWHPGELVAAVRSLDPFLATVAVGHLLLALLGTYLLALASLGLLLSLGALPVSAPIRRLTRFALSFSLPGTRTVVAWTLGLATLSVPLTPINSFAATPGSPAGGPPALTWLGPAPAPPSLHLVRPDRPEAPPGPISSPTTATAPASVQPIPTAPSAAVPPPTAATITPTSGIPVGPVASSPPDPVPQTWTVRPGDHLWSIAARTLAAAHSGNPPDEEAIAAYWWQVVTLNRPHLPDPADIDLLYPGDVVTLPPVPEA